MLSRRSQRVGDEGDTRSGVGEISVCSRHTHPAYSNLQGLISVIAETYAATGKLRDLSADDIGKPNVGGYVHDIEASVVHFGSSTGFFADKMFNKWAEISLGGGVLYESNVVDSYSVVQDKTFPVVADASRRKERSGLESSGGDCAMRPWVT